MYNVDNIKGMSLRHMYNVDNISGMSKTLHVRVKRFFRELNPNYQYKTIEVPLPDDRSRCIHVYVYIIGYYRWMIYFTHLDQQTIRRLGLSTCLVVRENVCLLPWNWLITHQSCSLMNLLGKNTRRELNTCKKFLIVIIG